MLSRRNMLGFWARVQNLIWPKMGFWRTLRHLTHRMARLSASPHAIALGFAVGAFVSFTPFIGVHFVLAALLAFFLRASILASAIGTFVGNPMTYPFIWLATYNVGASILGRATKTELVLAVPQNSHGLVSEGFLVQVAMLWRVIEPVFLPLIVGGILLGLICAALSYWLVRVSVGRLKTQRKHRRGAWRLPVKSTPDT